MNVLLFIALSCSKPILINQTKFPWNDFDRATVKRAQKRCKTLYSPKHCLKWFIKTDTIDYRAICAK